MKSNTILPVLSIIFLFSNCSNKKRGDCDFIDENLHIGDRFINHVDSLASFKDTTVYTSFHSVTNFKWDRMFILSDYSSRKHAAQKIGIDHPDLGDMPERFKQLVFTCTNKIVYIENLNVRKLGIDITGPLDTTSYSKELDGYIKRLDYYDITMDSIAVARYNSNNAYIVDCFFDGKRLYKFPYPVNKEYSVPIDPATNK